MPRLANASHMTSWSSPWKRIRSAASIASRASSIDVEPCWSRNASNISWTQRRLPGHLRATSGALSRDALRAALLELLVGVGVAGVPLLHERLPDLPLGAVPDLAVGVDLVAGGVEPVVRVVQRVRVDRVVTDADGLVAGGVRADRPRVGAGGVAVAEHVLAGDQVAPRLAHRAALLGGDALVGAADHAVGDRVGVLVADDAHVERAVGARGVERAGDRLEEVLVGDAGDAVLQGDLVGVVPTEVRRGAAGQRAGLDVADLRVVRAGRVGVPAQVVLLEVVVALGEAEPVAVVVHPVVRHEEVGGREVDVVATGAQLGRVALRVVPGVRERVEVLPGGGERRLRGAAGGQRVAPGLTVAGVVAAGGERRRLGGVVVVPRGAVGLLEGARGGAARAADPAADHGVLRGGAGRSSPATGSR